MRARRWGNEKRALEGADVVSWRRPGLHPGSKTTFHKNKAVWDAASKELKKKYIRAGYTNRGLWKDFRKEIQSQYSNGKVPGKRSSKLVSAKVKKEHRHPDIKRENDDIIEISD